MSLTPAYLEEDAFCEKPLTISDVGSRATVQEIEQDGQRYKDAYMRHAQFVFSRVQPKVCKKTKRGYVTLRARKFESKTRCKTCKKDIRAS